MPVIGHALVGLATARHFDPARAGAPGVIWWTPVVIGLAYLPDLIAQAGAMAGWTEAGLAGHSAIVGAALGAIVGAAWARVTGARTSTLVGIAVGSILAHDALDLMQATDRMPLWPISRRLVSAGPVALPQAPLVECLVFGLLFLVHATWLRAVDRRQPPATSSSRPRMQWTSRAIVGGIVVAALATHLMRRSREVQYQTAERLLRLGQYTEALAMAEGADAWPSTARPGRLDVIRGEAYDGLGDKSRAEESFKRAYRRDPTNFWALADLVELYASLNRPADERRRLIEPLARELRRNFPSEPALNDVMARVAERLEEP